MTQPPAQPGPRVFYDRVPAEAQIPAVKEPVHGAILDARLWQCARILWESAAARAKLPPGQRLPAQFSVTATLLTLLMYDVLDAWTLAGLEPGEPAQIHPGQLIAAERVNIISARALAGVELYPELLNARRMFNSMGFIDPDLEAPATASSPTPAERGDRAREPLLVRFIAEIQNPDWPDCPPITGAAQVAHRPAAPGTGQEAAP